MAEAPTRVYLVVRELECGSGIMSAWGTPHEAQGDADRRNARSLIHRVEPWVVAGVQPDEPSEREFARWFLTRPMHLQRQFVLGWLRALEGPERANVARLAEQVPT